MVEQDIYDKRIAELMKRKTVLIETLKRLLALTLKPRTGPKEEASKVPGNDTSPETCTS